MQPPIYLITDTSSGKQYVGSAYGQGGIFGRWTAYSNTGHGGNVELRGLDPHHFEFSILEIVPALLSEIDILERESRWKARLGTRKFGLNKN